MNVPSTRSTMQPLLVEHHTLTTALGVGMEAQWRALTEGRHGLTRCDYDDATLETWIGCVDGLENVELPARWHDYGCRNNQLTELALQQDDFIAAVAQARERHGGQRIGVFLGTSSGGIQATERAYRDRDPETDELPGDFVYHTTHNVYSVADYLRQRLQLAGPAAVISTACSSSAKTFASAYRALQSGWCDAAIVGGVDSLCHTTLHGFNALQLLSDEICRPCDRDRRGINIGEAGGFALVRLAEPGQSGLAVCGYGESSDAYHMSAPRPDGSQAAGAMQSALQRAGLEPDAIDYVNLHGTGTQANDLSEDKALQQVFTHAPAVSSTKGWTGHTLGAAGIVEALFSLICLEKGWAPQSLNTRHVDPELKSRVLMAPEQHDVSYVLSNAFGFGGSNCSLVLGRVG